MCVVVVVVMGFARVMEMCVCAGGGDGVCKGSGDGCVCVWW